MRLTNLIPEEPPVEGWTAVYRLYDAANELLYVGVTNKPKTRWRYHRKSKAWWPNVARTTVDWHETRAAALDAERAAIESELPVYNAVHHPVNWPAVLERREQRERELIAQAPRKQITIADHLGDQLTPEQVRKIIAIFGFTKPREER